MIRRFKDDDLFEVNKLLQIFNVKYDDTNGFTNIIVYEENTKVVGVLVYSLIYDRIEIEYIVVDEEYKRLGIGSKLLKYIENSGIKNITLEVNINNTYAIKLYNKYGFNVVAIRKGYYNGVDGYLMERKMM